MRLSDVASILDSLPDAVVVVDSGGEIRLFNHQAEVLFGHRRAAVVGRKIEVLVPAEARQGHPVLRDGYFAEPVFRPMGAGRELRAVKADGAAFPAEISLSALDTEEGRFVAAAVRDSTERRRAEAKFRGLLEAAPDAVVGVDADGRIVLANGQAVRLFGYDREELLGQPVEILVPDAVKELHPGHRARYFSEPTTRPMGAGLKLAGRRRDGSEFPAEISLSTLEMEDGVIVSAAIRDATERIRVESEREQLKARQSERLEILGQLAGGIAHDFNNLLALILSYGRFVAKEVAGDKALSEDVAEILAAAERAAALTRQLLIFGRRDVVRPEVLDLNEVVQSMEKILRRTIGEHIELRTEFAGPASVMADPGQIEQVILNLSLNARDAMPGGGLLLLRTETVVEDRPPDGAPSQPQVRLTVSDTGVGMPPEVRTRVFEPFFTTKPKGHGTGLGLATVYSIVSQAGGQIEIYSEEGKGTVFKVSFPVAAGEAAQADGEDQPVPGGDGQTILVVEDEVGVREITARILREHGYAVVVAADGPAEALELCRAGEVFVDLLVTDVVMPAMSGRDLAEQIKQIRPDLPVVFISGYSHDVIAHQGVLEPGVRLVEKPFTDQALLRTVHAALAG